MRLCDACNKGTHTTCLDPPLTAVPKGAWLCTDCNNDSDTDPKAPELVDLTRTDITEDLATLQYLKTCQFAQHSTEQEKTRIRARSHRYRYEGEQLFHKASAKPIPATADRAKIIAKAHSYGHYGIDKTTNIVQNHYWWWGLKDQTKEYVKTCDPCKLGSAKFNEPMEMQPIAVQGMYHKVGTDMIGPLQTSRSGNRFIIVAIDYLTKMIEAAAVPNKSSQTRADFFYREIICRHGTPVEVITDQGGEFQGKLQALLDRCGIDHRRTSPYHPQANGLTGRANQTLVKTLFKMTTDDPHDWDKQIPTALMGYRATRQASTKYSPFFMLHGHEMVLPINNKGRTVNAEHGELSKSFMANQFGPSQAVVAEALANIVHAQNKQMATYAKKQLHGAVPTRITSPTAPKSTVTMPVPILPTTDTPVTTVISPPAQLDTATEEDIPSSSKLPILVPETAVASTPIKESTLPARHKKRAKVEIKEGDFIVTKFTRWYVRMETGRVNWFQKQRDLTLSKDSQITPNKLQSLLMPMVLHGPKEELDSACGNE